MTDVGQAWYVKSRQQWTCPSCSAVRFVGEMIYRDKKTNLRYCPECWLSQSHVLASVRTKLIPEKLTPEQKALKLVSELCVQYGLNLEVTTDFVRAYDNVVNFEVTKHDMYLNFGGVRNCVHLNSRLTPYVIRRRTGPEMPLADKLYSAIKWHLSESGVRHIWIGQTGGGNAGEVREYLLSKVKTP